MGGKATGGGRNRPTCIEIDSKYFRLESMRSYPERLFFYLLLQLKRVFGRPVGDIRTRVHFSSILHRGEERQMSAALYIDEHLQRATGTNSGDIKAELKYATMHSVNHAATAAGSIPNAVYDNGCIYAFGQAFLISKLGPPRFKRVVACDSMVLCSTPSGGRYFGDWLLADSLLDFVADDNQISALKIEPHASYPHAKRISEILKFPEVRQDDVLLIRNLCIVSDIGFNEYKKNRLKLIRDRFQENYRGLKGAEKVYLRRGKSNAVTPRGLINEELLIEGLRTQGFLILDPSEHTVDEIFEKINSCAIVVGVEGSQLSYGFLALRNSGIMIALQPPFRFQASFRPRCDAVGLRWGFFIGIARGDFFEIDVNELNVFLEGILIQSH